MFLKTILTTAALASALQMAASTSAAAQSDDAAVMRGVLIAKRNCSQCHSLVVGEPSPNAKAPPFHELYRRYPAGSLQEAFDKGLLTHTRAMPRLRLTPAEINDLKAYFRTMRAEGQRESSIGRSGPYRLASR